MSNIAGGCRQSFYSLLELGLMGESFTHRGRPDGRVSDAVAHLSSDLGQLQTQQVGIQYSPGRVGPGRSALCL
jgi:hypothetical protein